MLTSHTSCLCVDDWWCLLVIPLNDNARMQIHWSELIRVHFMKHLNITQLSSYHQLGGLVVRNVAFKSGGRGFESCWSLTILLCRVGCVTTADAFWRALTLTVHDAWQVLIAWRPLTRADACWRVLTRADACWRVLTRADTSWQTLTDANER